MTRCDRPRRTAQRGFSYLWLLLLVVLLGLSAAMACEIYMTSVQRDKEVELLAIGRQFRVAIARYHETLNQGRREYPANLDDLLLDKRMTGGRRHLRKVFVDPMTGTPEWGLVRVAGRIVGVQSLSQATPIKQAGFESEDAGFVGKQKYSEWTFTYPSDLMQRSQQEVPGEVTAPGLAASAVTPSPEGPASSAFALKP